MKKIFGIALFILLLTVISACSNKEPANDKAAGPKVKQTGVKEKAAANPGNEVFQKSCITCHSSGDIIGGQTMIDGAKIHADFKTKEDLMAFVTKNMPKSAPGSLSQEEYDAVVKYLWDQK